MTTEIVTIPLNKLAPFAGNVRKTRNKGFIAELAASIKAHGLQQNLVVKPEGNRFAVVAGGQRLLAFRQLAEAGEIKATHPVPCKIANGDLDPVEISLLENVLRENMTVFQEVSAFLSLTEAGNSVADIATRFGVSEKIVNGRLALARVSPALWKLYEEDQLTLAVLQAFTLTDDHATQERVWNDLPPWDQDKPNAIRRILLKEEIPATDKRVRFVGLDAYEAAGGIVRRDLFSEGEDGASIVDPELLLRLVNNKLQLLAADAKAEGWKWIDVQPQTDHQALGKFRRIQPLPVPLPKKDAAKVAKLEQKLAKLQEQTETDAEADQDALYDEMESLQDQIEEIENKRTAAFDADTKAQCGTIVTIGHDGEPQLIRGLLRKEDAAQLASGRDPEETDTTTEEPTSDQPQQYSATLVETLTTIKTAAIAAELSQQPKIGLAAVVHALVVCQFGFDLHLYSTQTSIQINSTQPNLAEAASSLAVQSLSEQKTAWLQRFPKSPNALWQWILVQPQDTLLQLLTFCAALSLNGIRTKNDSGQARIHHADTLATALSMDMRNWFAPTADNFFNRVSKPSILQAMADSGKPADANTAAKLKKAALADLAEKALAGSGWLPEPIRIAPSVADGNSFELSDDREEVTSEQQ